MESDWTDNNKQYWEEVSNKYQTFYNDKWSVLENNFVKNYIQKVKSIEFENVLDLGCGDGLGYNICSSINPNIAYVGVDISNKMLDNLKAQYPKAVTKNLKMSNLKDIDNDSFDLVISIFTAFSYTDNVNKTLEEIHRVLKPNGKILISVISKYSLRRLIKLKFGKQERYKTRGITSNSFSYSWVFSKREIATKIKINFSEVKTIGYNSLGGISFCTKYPKLWKLNLFISKLIPNFSHELLTTGKKN